MLAFIDSPVQLIVVMLVILIVFGPQKLPEIGQQLGRAIRELRRSTQEFTNAINLDDHHTPTYDPPRYDNYNSTYSTDPNTGYSVPDASTWQSESAPAAIPAPETPRGDFAAAALADTAAEDYGVPTSDEANRPH